MPLCAGHGNAEDFISILPGGWSKPSLESLRNTFQRMGVESNDLHAMLADFDVDHPVVAAWLDDTMASLDLVVSAISATLDP